MALKNWVGGASPVTNVKTVTIDTAADGVTYGIGVNSQGISEDRTTSSVEYTATGTDTVESIATALETAWNNSQDALIGYASVSRAGAVLTFTATISGRPVLLTLTQGGANMTLATITSNEGPNAYLTDGNWRDETGAATTAPAAGDDVTIGEGIDSILYDLDQTAIALNKFQIGNKFAGATIGESGGAALAVTATSGSAYVAAPSVGHINLRLNGGANIWVRALNGTMRLRGAHGQVRVQTGAVIGEVSLETSVAAPPSTNAGLFMMGCPSARVLIDKDYVRSDGSELPVRVDSGVLETLSPLDTGESAPLDTGYGVFGAGTMIVRQASGAAFTWGKGMHIGTGGVCDYRAGGVLSGRIAVEGGTFTLANNGSAELRVTGLVNVIEAGLIDANSNISNLDWVNTILRNGGEVRGPIGSNVGWS